MNILVVPHELAELHETQNPNTDPATAKYNILPAPRLHAFPELVKSVRRADAVYCWLTNKGALPADVAEVIHIALVLDKPCYAGIASVEIRGSLREDYFRGAVLSPDPLAGLEQLWTTESFCQSIRSGIRRMESKWDGACRVCGGTYKAGSRISRDPTKKGAAHIDCGVATAGEPLPATVLQSIVEELRAQINKLERECTDLVFKNGMLTQQLKAKTE